MTTSKARDYPNHNITGTKSNVFRRLAARSRKVNTVSTTSTIQQPPMLTPRSSRRSSMKIGGSQDWDAPPTYASTLSSPGTVIEPILAQSYDDSPYAYLRQFDTVFVVDDSGSMAGRNWQETSDALAAIAPICTQQDTDGIDIYFLNHHNSRSDSGNGAYTNVTTKEAVQDIFSTIRPSGSTPTGTRLSQILRPYLREAQRDNERRRRGQKTYVKPLNVIVITDGVPTDDVESAIVSAARKLDDMGAELWQLGIQFFQVGRDRSATEELRELDDALSAEYGIRDMVDTVPWSGQDGATLTAERIMKVTMGAINRRLDRKRMSSEGFSRRTV